MINGAHYELDENFTDVCLSRRFFIYLDPSDDELFIIQDMCWDAWIRLPQFLAEAPGFDMASWYEQQLAVLVEFFECPDPPPKNHPGHKPDDDSGAGSSVAMGKTCAVPLNHVSTGSMWKVTHCENHTTLELNGVQISHGNYPAVQQNAAVAKDTSCKVPRPVVVAVKTDGHLACTLLDSGSLGDFLSSTLADQLNVKRVKLNAPLTLQLAVQGSHSKINSGAKVRFEYQKISEERYFDIINISNYNIILGMP